MSIHYSSLFIKENISSFNDLLKYDKECLLVLDTNICIYLRDFYQSPIKFVDKYPNIWSELREFLLHVRRFNLPVNIGLGVDEASRSVDTFTIINEKQEQMKRHVTSVLEMDVYELLSYTNTLSFHTPKKDETKKTQTKIDAAQQNSAFSNLCVVHYACMLKAYLLNLEIQDNKINNVEAFYKFLDFMDKEIDLISTSVLSFGLHYFSGNTTVKRLLNKKGKNSKIAEQVIHNIWNASLDLCFPILVSNFFDSNKYIPIFVTSDNALNVIFNSLKMRVVFTEGNKISNVPNMIEVNYTDTSWNPEELKQVENEVDRVTNLRVKRQNSSKEINEEIKRILFLVKGLENEVIGGILTK